MKGSLYVNDVLKQKNKNHDVLIQRTLSRGKLSLIITMNEWSVNLCE